MIDWRYLAASVLAGLATFFGYEQVERLRHPVQIFDALGLSLFAVVGIGKALEHGMSPGGAVMLGMLSGIGGGLARDVLLAEIPSVLKKELYALAALLGAACVVIGSRLQWSQAWSAACGAGACFALRFLAIRLDWHLPTARRPREH